MSKPKAVFNWSGGKDSALALHKVLAAGEIKVASLLTSVSGQFNRVSMHGVRLELLDMQAASVGIPLVKMFTPEMPDMETYEQQMHAVLGKLRKQGVTTSIFGDIFLEDLRRYRENQLARRNLNASFPLWKIPTDKLIKEFIDLGFKAVIVCVNEKYLDKSFAGRVIDEDFVRDLPPTVDLCGENGEFHSFVYDGPIFRQPIPFVKGEIVYRKYEPTKRDVKETRTRDRVNTILKQQTPAPFQYGFWYCDLIKTDSESQRGTPLG
jgi:uncharacterized protein (TIGR00290 family)